MLSSAPGVALVLCMQMLLPEEWEMRQPHTGAPRCLSVGSEWGAECRAHWQLLGSWLLRRNGVVPAGYSSSEEMLHMTLTEVFVACICNWRQKGLQLKSSP